MSETNPLPPGRVHGLIMAGGGGTRFWPRSRQKLPKQFLTLQGDRSLLQQTADRLEGLVPPENLLVITSKDHVGRTHEQLPHLKPGQVVGEPTGRDTAPCVGLAAALVARRDPEAILVTCPADHVIEPVASFRRALQAACLMVEEHPGAFVTLGIPPTFPSTGYGYIQRGEPLPARMGIEAARVGAFKEKPAAEQAREYVRTGEYYWNAGIFIWKAKAVLDSLQKLRPGLFAGVTEIADAWDTPHRSEVLERVFPTLEKISVDYALLECHPQVLVLRAPFNWDDVGSWLALERLQPQDADGNTVQGTHLGIRTKNCVISGQSGTLITTLGVEDLLIIQDGECLLIARKDEEGNVKQLVEEMKKRQLGNHL